ncbi:MAG: hypothetical protein IJT73_10450 [Selenomonadaceae bacterium]|nr:hypothetical protein [Selenomonadaceae bacterium]
MSEPEILGTVFQKSLLKLNPELRDKILCQEIFNCWYEIFQTFADKFFPGQSRRQNFSS